MHRLHHMITQPSYKLENHIHLVGLYRLDSLYKTLLAQLIDFTFLFER